MSHLKLIPAVFAVAAISLWGCTAEAPKSAPADSGAGKKVDEVKKPAKKPVKVTSVAQLTSAHRRAAKKQWVICATCHGTDGKGDGVAGKNLPVKPRDYTDKTWQSSVTDERLFKVIKEGGASVGLSPLMIPYGNLPDSTIWALVEKVRKFGK